MISKNITSYFILINAFVKKEKTNKDILFIAFSLAVIYACSYLLIITFFPISNYLEFPDFERVALRYQREWYEELNSVLGNPCLGYELIPSSLVAEWHSHYMTMPAPEVQDDIPILKQAVNLYCKKQSTAFLASQASWLSTISDYIFFFFYESNNSGSANRLQPWVNDFIICFVLVYFGS